MANVIDPVCGMQIDDQQTAITSQFMNRTYYFCSLGCKQQFDNDPQQYAVQPASRLDARRSGARGTRLDGCASAGS